MTNHNDKYDAKGLPFFARYLEGQIDQEISDEALEKIAGGGKGRVETEKYPSDNDEVETKKYPSDDDDVNVGI